MAFLLCLRLPLLFAVNVQLIPCSSIVMASQSAYSRLDLVHPRPLDCGDVDNFYDLSQVLALCLSSVDLSEYVTVSKLQRNQ